MTFVNPIWLWFLFALPLPALVEIWCVVLDRKRMAGLVARPLWGRVLRRPAEAWRWIRFGLLLLGAAGILVALARPQYGIVREKIEREGVDVVLLLDTSGSMATEDVSPNRFFLAKQALMSLVTRLEGDRFGLVAFEGEAYPLVPLTLDADAVGLFLETLDPGIVPAPGSSIGVGVAKSLDLFVDKDRRNKVMVLVSDGEDLEGEVEDAVKLAKKNGVVIHTVGIGTEKGQPVPNFDREGNRSGFKKDEDGSVVVSRLHSETLEAIASGTGGRYFRITPADTSLSQLAIVIEGLEEKALQQEWSIRKKDWFQLPLGIGLGAIFLALLFPFPNLRRKKMPEAARMPMASRAAIFLLFVLMASRSSAQSASSAGEAPPPVPPPPPGSSASAPSRPSRSAQALDELLLRPNRRTRSGKKDFELGNHPGALESFESAAASRPEDPAARFNLADALYKNGKFDEAGAIYRSLAADEKSPVAAASRYNLGNSLFQKQDYSSAVKAYRDALHAAPDDPDTKRNLEMALRALLKEEQQKKQDQQKDKDKKDDKKKDQQQQQKPGDDKKDDKNQKNQPKPDRPKSDEEKEQERYQKEAGMPKERAMQLLDALQQNEKNEQKKILAARPVPKKKRKDW